MLMNTVTAPAAYGVNPGKKLWVEDDKGAAWLCYAVKTRLVSAEDELDEIVETYIKPLVQPGDVVFLSEKMVACTQGRAIPLWNIKPGFWAKVLSRFVVRRPGGIGLGMPQTMQCAITECGLPRVLLAAAAGALGKALGKSGWFYRVAGAKAAAIDGPCHWTIPPYNHAVVLAPAAPGAAARRVSELLGGNLVLIVDLNDFGGRVLGCSHPEADPDVLLPLLTQNPLGQSDECTPAGILRPMAERPAVGQIAPANAGQTARAGV